MGSAMLMSRGARPMAARAGLLGCVVLLLIGEAITFWVLLHHLRVPHHSLLLVTIATPLFGAAVALFARVHMSARTALWFLIGTATVFQLIALSQQPLTSDDDYRYIWDGRVQLAGIDPYHYTPQDPHLSALRDTLLFGTPGHCGHPIPGGCTAINRPAVHTVYPPVAQALFVVVRLASFGGHGGRRPFQVVAAMGTIAVTILLARRAHRTGRALWPVAIWAWCPVTISEFGNNAHIDWLAVLLAVLALQAAAARRTATAGALLGAAGATKLYPLLVLPSVLRRRPKVLIGAAVAVVAATYIPHVIAVGTKVIGFLPGYLHQEGYSSGGRLLLLGSVLPHSVAIILGAMIAASVVAWAYRRSDPDRPEVSAVVVAGVALLIATPNYGWYATLLLALVVMSERWEWVPVAMAPTFTYLYRGEWLHSGIPSSAIYGIAALTTLALASGRRPSRPRSTGSV